MKKYWMIGFGLTGLGIISFYLWRTKKPGLFSGMSYPVKSEITSPYGNRINPTNGQSEFHNGIDLRAAVGTSVKSPYDGKVVSQFSADKGGSQMMIEHTNGYTTGYAHLSGYSVNVGDSVKKGQEIARTGDSGSVTGPHLHTTLRNKEGQILDPQKYYV